MLGMLDEKLDRAVLEAMLSTARRHGPRLASANTDRRQSRPRPSTPHIWNAPHLAEQGHAI